MCLKDPVPIFRVRMERCLGKPQHHLFMGWIINILNPPPGSALWMQSGALGLPIGASATPTVWRKGSSHHLDQERGFVSRTSMAVRIAPPLRNKQKRRRSLCMKRLRIAQSFRTVLTQPRWAPGAAGPNAPKSASLRTRPPHKEVGFVPATKPLFRLTQH